MRDTSPKKVNQPPARPAGVQPPIETIVTKAPQAAEQDQKTIDAGWILIGFWVLIAIVVIMGWLIL